MCYVLLSGRHKKTWGETAWEKVRGNYNGLSHVPSKRREEIKSGTSGCGLFVVAYFQPATSIGPLQVLGKSIIELITDGDLTVCAVHCVCVQNSELDFLIFFNIVFWFLVFHLHMTLCGSLGVKYQEPIRQICAHLYWQNCWEKTAVKQTEKTFQS